MNPEYEVLSAWAEWAFEEWCNQNGYEDVVSSNEPGREERYQEARKKWKASNKTIDPRAKGEPINGNAPMDYAELMENFEKIGKTIKTTINKVGIKPEKLCEVNMLVIPEITVSQDATYIKFSDHLSNKTVALEEGLVNADYDPDGDLVGIEIISPVFVKLENLDGYDLLVPKRRDDGVKKDPTDMESPEHGES